MYDKIKQATAVMVEAVGFGGFAVPLLAQRVEGLLDRGTGREQVPPTDCLGDDGCDSLQGKGSAERAAASLEQAFADLGNKFATGAAALQVLAAGRPRTLNPAVHEQVYLIGREALLNSLLHSASTRIEAEIEYLPGRLRLVVRDNGSGIDAEVLRTGRDPLSGILRMRECARSIGAKLEIWSRKGAGTEVEISVPYDHSLSGTTTSGVAPLLNLI